MNLQNYRPHFRATLVLGLPLIGSHVARMGLGVIDTVMLGRYGVEELAALVLATSLLLLLMMLGIGYAMGVMGVLATHIARDNEAEVRRAARMALWLSCLHSLAVMPLMWWSEALFLAIGQEPLTAAYAQDYLRIAGWGLLPMLAGLTLSSYLASMERTAIVMWITVAGLPVNAALNYVLIFGYGPIPELGVEGAAIASLGVQIFQLILLAFYSGWLPEARRYNLFQRIWRPDWSAFAAIFGLGMPIGLSLIAEGGLFAASNVMAGWISTKSLAAHGIALQISSLTFMIPLGLSNAATIRAGQMMGRYDTEGMRHAGHVAIFLAVVFALMSMALFLSIPETLVTLYLDPNDVDTPDLIALGAYLLVFAGFFQIADGVQVVTMGLLRGVQDTRVPMWIAALSYWVVGMPAAWILAFPLGMGAAGLWMGLIIGLSVAAVLLSRRFWRGLNRGDWTALPVAE